MLRKVGVPVQLVVILPLQGGGEPGYCVHCIHHGHLYTKTVTSEGTTFSHKINNKGFGVLECRKGI